MIDGVSGARVGPLIGSSTRAEGDPGRWLKGCGETGRGCLRELGPMRQYLRGLARALRAFGKEERHEKAEDKIEALDRS
jgi:hypothetical protein